MKILTADCQSGLFVVLGRAESVRRDNAIVIKLNYQILGFPLSKKRIIVGSISPGKFAILSA